MAGEELFLWGIGAPRFYTAMSVFILSVGQWIFFSCLSVYLHFKRERLWIQSRQQKENVSIKIGETKKTDGLNISVESIPDRNPAMLNRSTDTLIHHEKLNVWSLYFDDEIPLGWDWILPALTGGIMVLGFFIVEFILEVPNDPFQYHTASIIVLQLLLLLFVVWLVFRITEVLVPSEHFLFRRHHKFNQPRPKKHQGATGRTLIPTLMKYVRLTIIIMFGCIMAQSLGFPITSLLGSLGIIGVAVAFAASALLQNLFGACAVVLEEMFHIGDWVRVGDVEGSVEHIGFRTTTIRQWDKRVSIIPNSMFISTVVHNLQETKPYRIKFVVNLPVTTPVEKIEKFLIKGRNFFHKHPLLNPGGRFYLNQMTMQSIELMVYVFMKEPWNPKDDTEHNWEWYSKSLQLNEDIVLKMLRISKKLGVEISVPQQKIHMSEPGGLAVVAEHHSKKLE